MKPIHMKWVENMGTQTWTQSNETMYKLETMNGSSLERIHFFAPNDEIAEMMKQAILQKTKSSSVGNLMRMQ